MKKILVFLLTCVLLAGCASDNERLPIEDGKFAVTAEEFCERYKECISSNDEYEGISLGEMTEDMENGIFDYEILYQSQETNYHLAFIKEENNDNVKTISLTSANLNDNDNSNIMSKIIRCLIRACDSTLPDSELQDIVECLFQSDVTPEMILENDFPTDQTIRNNILYTGKYHRSGSNISLIIMVKPNNEENEQQ